MNETELRKLFPQASESFIRKNLSGAVGGLQAPISKPTTPSPLASRPCQRKASEVRVVICVTIIACLRRAYDSDNLVGSGKATRDAIAESLTIDDADPRVEWRYEQIQCRNEGTLVLIQSL